VKRHDIRNKEVAGVIATIKSFFRGGQLGAIARQHRVDVDDVVQAVVTYHLTQKHGLTFLQGEDGRARCYVTARARTLDAVRSKKRNPWGHEIREDALGCAPTPLDVLIEREDSDRNARMAMQLSGSKITSGRLQGTSYAQLAAEAGVCTSTMWRRMQKRMKEARFSLSQLSLFPEGAQSGGGRGVETMGGFQP
jgi:DNA-directed RNA polymerase specialized sigma24 family protein